LQRTIEQIRGVTSARVILGDNDEIAEIHLVGIPGRGPKQIVRDTESLLYARFGMRVDYRRISLVQLDADGNAAGPTRLRFISAAAHPQASDRVRVVLHNGKTQVEGVASGSIADGGLAAARATLNAVQALIGQVAQLRLQQAQTIVVEGQQILLVAVSALTPTGEERLTGTCLVGNDLLPAAAKATLDAVNRRLPVWANMKKGD